MFLVHLFVTVTYTLLGKFLQKGRIGLTIRGRLACNPVMQAHLDG